MYSMDRSWEYTADLRFGDRAQRHKCWVMDAQNEQLSKVKADGYAERKSTEGSWWRHRAGDTYGMQGGFLACSWEGSWLRPRDRARVIWPYMGITNDHM